MTKQILVLGLAAVGLFMANGCVSEVDREIDCSTICAAYQDCLPGDQNEEQCRDRCDNATAGDVDECDACVDTAATCTECTVECAGPLAG